MCFEPHHKSINLSLFIWSLVVVVVFFAIFTEFSHWALLLLFVLGSVPMVREKAGKKKFKLGKIIIWKAQGVPQ